MKKIDEIKKCGKNITHEVKEHMKIQSIEKMQRNKKNKIKTR